MTCMRYGQVELSTLSLREFIALAFLDITVKVILLALNSIKTYSLLHSW
jgi:hypothetical protein